MSLRDEVFAYIKKKYGAEPEYLWRSYPDSLNERAVDVGAIYEGSEREEVLGLIRKYDIRYIYVGKLERGKFSALNDELLREIGTVVYADGETYIVEVP